MFNRNYEDILLVKFDVVNLCTNIPHTFELKVLNYWLENHPESLHARLFNKEFVLECAKFILQNNNLKFNNEFYNQINGAVMGEIFAPTCATLSMGKFEIKLYSVWTFKHLELLAQHVKGNWNCFLENCYTLLKKSQISSEKLLLTLNSILQYSSLWNKYVVYTTIINFQMNIVYRCKIKNRKINPFKTFKLLIS